MEKSSDDIESLKDLNAYQYLKEEGLPTEEYAKRWMAITGKSRASFFRLRRNVSEHGIVKLCELLKEQKEQKEQKKRDRQRDKLIKKKQRLLRQNDVFIHLKLDKSSVGQLNFWLQVLNSDSTEILEDAISRFPDDLSGRKKKRKVSREERQWRKETLLRSMKEEEDFLVEAKKRFPESIKDQEKFWITATGKSRASFFRIKRRSKSDSSKESSESDDTTNNSESSLDTTKTVQRPKHHHSGGHSGRIARDWSGKKIGRLLVIRRRFDLELARRTHGSPLWECLCDCGKAVIVPSSSLWSAEKAIQLGKVGGTRSCGCYHVEKTLERGQGRINFLKTFEDWNEDSDFGFAAEQMRLMTMDAEYTAALQC